MKCVLCDTEITDDFYPRPIHTPEGPRPAHRICMQREVLGGIGHHLDHQYWCVERHDPDAGLDWYKSALFVEQLVRSFGLDYVLEKSFTEMFD